eukprot:gene167-286_t
MNLFKLFCVVTIQHVIGASFPSRNLCAIDHRITPTTYHNYHDEILSVKGSACSKNFGTFELDGKIYSCNHFPESWGIKNFDELLQPTVDTELALKTLDVFLGAIYDKSVEMNTEACHARSLTTVRCGGEHPWKKAPWAAKLNNQPIRGVNIGGLFVLESWITPAFIDWPKPVREGTNIIDQYTFSLYCDLTNSCSKLEDCLSVTGFPSAPYILPKESITHSIHPITQVIRWAQNAGLHVILDLHGAPGSQNGFDNSGQQAPYTQPLTEWGSGWLEDENNVQGTVDTVSAMAEYVTYIEVTFGLNNVIALEVLNEPFVFLELDRVREYYLTAMDAVRLQHPAIPILLHDAFRLEEWDFLLDEIPHSHVYMDNHNYFAFFYQQESDLEGDKEKQRLYADAACRMTTTLKHSSCTSAPVLVGEWSLAIDNCMPRLDVRFEDVGQCKYLHHRL